ncbi:MAG: dihydroorotate dehydrogenase electron transfer subunit [Candidatus Latescibacteria bacterium]|nr:dihydroorotate dehydrogenase electron transfer subunit [Candidatus Latescibacterota bacterium]
MIKKSGLEMHEYEAGILRTDFRCEKSCIIDLSCKAIAREALPGQFVQVRVGSGTDPFLRRTFSLCGTDPARGEIRLLVDIVGRGTELLCSMKRGMNVNIIGSLGTGFDMKLGGTGTCVLVAGGSGAAPLIFLANRLITSTKRPVVFIMGAKSSVYLSVIEGLKSDGIIVKTATDDGSAGFCGPVSELLDKQIEDIKPDALYTCGPHAMMKAVSHLAEKYSIPCQISLEERMACGVGACLGCAAPLRDGRMVRTCVDGPVFHASEVAW